MPLITFNPIGITVDVPVGTPLLDAAKKAGIHVETPCGGDGTCGKCMVRIESGAVDFKNNGILSKHIMDQGGVLICKSTVLDVPVCVHYFSNSVKEQGKFSKMSDDMLLVDSSLLPSIADYDPIVKPLELTVPEPSIGDGLSDYDRFKKAVTLQTGAVEMDIPLDCLKLLPTALREDNGRLFAMYYLDHGIAKITRISSCAFDINLGIAVDIGTTTIAVKLVDMEQGDLLSAKTDYNAQIACGLDVISRINYAQKPQRLEELRMKVLETINRIVFELSTENQVSNMDIHNVSIAGNTTMVHLLMGIMPEYIRLEPYTPAVYQVPMYKASELAIDISPNTPVFIAPSVGSYLGGDITSGVLCTSLAAKSPDICLFIDIGTNGEMVLGNDEFLIGCACSAGPAFEGGSIENGMRASLGAIERVEINKASGLCVYSTIGAVPPIGICGSGMISLIAGLLKTGWIDAAGKLDRTRPCEAIDASTKNAQYIIAPASDSPNSKAIFITEADIDNLIRAKAAIFSACRVMLQSVSMDFEDLTKVYIAGGCGRYLDIDRSKAIGLIPNLPSEKFEFIGNSSMIGAYMTLISRKHRENEYNLSQKITYMDLSTEPGYMDQYTAALFLPHTDSRLFQ